MCRKMHAGMASADPCSSLLQIGQESAGLKKMYISAHSAVDTQAFYISIGCSDAAEYTQEHVSAESYDRQMEYTL